MVETEGWLKYPTPFLIKNILDVLENFDRNVYKVISNEIDAYERAKSS